LAAFRKVGGLHQPKAATASALGARAVRAPAKSSGEIFSRAQETAREVRRQLAEDSRTPGLTPGQHNGGTISLRPIAEFHRDPVYSGDLHRADLGWATQAAAAGLSLEEIRDTILTARDLRHKGDAKRQLDYATRTAQKALAPE
jgi:hypothetical protein